MILGIKKETDTKGPAYKKLPAEVLSKGVVVHTLVTELILQCKNLDEITEAGERSEVLKVKCGVKVDQKTVKLSRLGSQVEAVHFTVADANAALQIVSR